MAIVAIDPILAIIGKVTPTGFTECCNSSCVPGSSSELIAWKPTTTSPSYCFVIQCLHALILSSKPTRTCNIDDEIGASTSCGASFCFHQWSRFQCLVHRSYIEHWASILEGVVSILRPLSFCLNPQANALEVHPHGRFMHVLMETSAGNITIELFHGSALRYGREFVKLVNDGYYDGFTSTVSSRISHSADAHIPSTQCLTQNRRIWMKDPWSAFSLEPQARQTRYSSRWPSHQTPRSQFF